jgi:Concanavalin A-like lectin/glucanases superfamily/Domain of unknown function (DUF2341)
MMKLFRILLIVLFGGLLAIFLDCMVACAQDPNPQTSFATTLLYANPSLYLNFNDPTTAFKDQVSGLSFTGPDLVSPFAYERTITIDHTKVGGSDAANFPVLIAGTYPYLATVANGGLVQNANGYDVMFFADSNLTTKLSWEVESYNATTGAVVYWVKVPTVSAETDTVIYLAYDNPSATTDWSNRTATWDSSFNAVYHLSAANPTLDSTANAQTLTPLNSPGSGTGKIDGDATFTASSHQYFLHSSPTVPTGTSPRTLEGWFKMGSSAVQEMMGWGDNGGTGHRFTLYWNNDGEIYNETEGGNATFSFTYDSNWHYYVATLPSGTTDCSILMYLDGSPQTTSCAGDAINTVATELRLGGIPATGAAYFTGSLDEVRVSNIARSAAWIAADYNNQSSPSTFYSVGSATAAPSTLCCGTVTPRQPGFDSTLANNTSAEFTWTGWNAAPNNTLGSAMEWSTPWSMMVQVDNLQWNRTGRLVLASKGDLATGSSWELYLQMAANNIGDPNVQLSQLCFERKSSSTSFNLGGGPLDMGICTDTGDQDVMPNGFNYNIVVTDSGTGASGQYGTATPLDIYINGLDKATGIAQNAFTSSFQNGFGDVAITVSGGTGYANSTAFTSSGGGANCSVTGFMTASGGVPNGISLSGNSLNYGCTSVPTINLTSPTGTGVTIAATLGGSSMKSTASPLMVPGYVSGGVYHGVAGAGSTQTPTYIDEFAIFPFVLNPTQINDLFYWTKFYQIVANTRSANRPVVLLADDGCADIGNATMTQFVIVLHTLGIIKLEGIISAGDSPHDAYDSSASFWRQMLDQAGLSNVPVGNLYAGTDSNKNWCQTASLNTYNASTPQASTGFPTSASVVRTVMANNPTTPVIIYNGPAPANNWLYDFMQSPADSISSLTGQQLWDRDVANGGAMWWQGVPSCTSSSYPSPTPCSGSWTTLDATASQYVFAHLDGMPTYQVGGTPQGYGQGFAYTRTAKDPMALACAAAGGSCSRAGWGQYALASLFTSYFTNGVTVGYSGGTGYASVTPFTSTGGGANCVVNGIMTASGGVPNGIETSWGAAQPLKSPDNVVVGMGSGCTSAPTLVLTNPAGTGVTLTAYPTTVCGTGSVSGSTYSFTSASCGNQYFVPFTQWANVGMPLIYNWFLNSLSDPPTNGRPMGAQ